MIKKFIREERFGIYQIEMFARRKVSRGIRPVEEISLACPPHPSLTISPRPDHHRETSVYVISFGRTYFAPICIGRRPREAFIRYCFRADERVRNFMHQDHQCTCTYCTRHTGTILFRDSEYTYVCIMYISFLYKNTFRIIFEYSDRNKSIYMVFKTYFK